MVTCLAIFPYFYPWTYITEMVQQANAVNIIYAKQTFLLLGGNIIFNNISLGYFFYTDQWVARANDESIYLFLKHHMIKVFPSRLGRLTICWITAYILTYIFLRYKIYTAGSSVSICIDMIVFSSQFVTFITLLIM